VGQAVLPLTRKTKIKGLPACCTDALLQKASFFSGHVEDYHVQKPRSHCYFGDRGGLFFILPDG
jgi:hypothetical protein